MPDETTSSAGSAHFWESLYRTNQFHWDLGVPTPVFRRLVEGGTLDPGKLLVLGAGRGHDARLFARHGFRVTAVDFALQAVEDMKRLDDPAFPVEILRSDFFELPEEWNGRFDYILDYTSFCAILPTRRPEYAGLAARLLKPGGRSIVLAFPIGTRPGGPPFTLQPNAIVTLFAGVGLVLRHREIPFDSVVSRKGYEELLLFEKV